MGQLLCLATIPEDARERVNKGPLKMATIYVTDLPYDFDAFLDDAVYDMGLLSDNEEEFLDDMLDIYERYGDQMTVTDFQAEMLDRIRMKIY